MIKLYKNSLKGLFSIVFLLALFFSFSNISQAQTTPPTTPVTTQPGTTPASPATPANTTTDTSATDRLDPCSSVGWFSSVLVGKLGCEIWLSFSTLLMQVAVTFLKLTGFLFDYATQKFILQISTLFNTAAGQESEYIYGAWSVIRDFANIIAFFGAIYTGFRYITGSDQSDFKKSVLKLFIYCIMVNFSFAISKFLIDISNVISLQVHGGILGFNLAEGYNISTRILEKMNLNYLTAQIGSTTGTLSGNFASFSVMWLAIIFVLATLVAFLYASIMILARSFILLACVIFSPVMFLNFAFPQMNSLHEKWRENFFGQLMFAPIFMIGLWVAFVLMQAAMVGEKQLGGAAFSAVGAATSDVSTLGNVVNMILAILAVVMAVKLSAAASGSAGKFVSGLVGKGMSAVGLAVATGGAGLAFRGAAGGASSMIKGSNWMQSRLKAAGTEGSAGGRFSRGMANLLDTGVGRMKGARVFGKDSVNDKLNIKSDKARKNIGAEKLKGLGLSDTLTRAGSAKEVDEIYKEASKREERQKTNPNEKFESYKFNREKTLDIKQDNSMQKIQLSNLEVKEKKLDNIKSGRDSNFNKALISGDDKNIEDQKRKLENTISLQQRIKSEVVKNKGSLRDSMKTNQSKLDAINPPGFIARKYRSLKAIGKSEEAQDKDELNMIPINKGAVAGTEPEKPGFLRTAEDKIRESRA